MLHRPRRAKVTHAARGGEWNGACRACGAGTTVLSLGTVTPRRSPPGFATSPFALRSALSVPAHTSPPDRLSTGVTPRWATSFAARAPASAPRSVPRDPHHSVDVVAVCEVGGPRPAQLPALPPQLCPSSPHRARRAQPNHGVDPNLEQPRRVCAAPRSARPWSGCRRGSLSPRPRPLRGRSRRQARSNQSSSTVLPVPRTLRRCDTFARLMNCALAWTSACQEHGNLPQQALERRH